MRRILAPFACLALWLAGPATAAGETEAAFGAYHAMVIGNDDYRHLPKLETAVADARALAGLLETRYGFTVRRLFNVGKREILRAVNDYRGSLGADDNLLIFYAGHGWLDRQTNTGFWQPVDAEADDDLNWIANEELTRRLAAMAARHVMVIADSCYSGTLLRGTSAPAPEGKGRDAWIRRMAQKRSRTAIVSGGLEPVEDSGRDGHSVFANALLAALDENREILDGQTLFQRISRPVVLNADQTPRFSDIRKAGHEGGAFLFVPKPKTDRPAQPVPKAAAPKTAALAPATGRKSSGERATPKVAPAARRAGFKECAFCPEMVVVPAGRFTMGSESRYEGPAHQVSIEQPFAVARTETSFAEWDACVAAGHCRHRPDDRGWGHSARPVIDVGYPDAIEYLAWLGAATGRSYRLLSEAEWEYAARAGTTTKRYWGDEIGTGHANCYQCGGDGGKTRPVASYPPNRFGLYDMLGNVHEWVADCGHQSYRGAPSDGTAWADDDCAERITRGGSWSTAWQAVTVSMRDARPAAARSQYTGFRVARSLRPDALQEWLPLAKAGDPVAQAHLAGLYLAAEPARAAEWLAKAAAAGLARAQYELGRLYGTGRGLPADPALAATWLRRAAEVGHQPAQTALGQLLAAGEAAGSDLVEAYMWLDLAASTGADEATAKAARAERAALRKAMDLTQIMEAQARGRDWLAARQGR